jgi:hypothetical protein
MRHICDDCPILNCDSEYSTHCNLSYLTVEAEPGAMYVIYSDVCNLVSIITKDKTLLPDLGDEV